MSYGRGISVLLPSEFESEPESRPAMSRVD